MEPSDLISGCALGVRLGASALAILLITASTVSRPVVPDSSTALMAGSAPVHRAARGADFGAGEPSADTRGLADWVADTRDNGSAAFIVVDKRAAQLHVFDADARWVASTAVLLGAALGDGSVPGIGSRPMATIQPGERTTPAGRFVGERGRNTLGEDVVWVDYDAAVSLHRVRLTNPAERRAERLASPTAADNRISYGCINVPALFYERHVQAIFARRHAVIYVLPDVRALQEVFGPDVAATSRSSGRLSLAGIGPAAHTGPP